MKPKIVVPRNLKFYPDQIKKLESLWNVSYYNIDPKDLDEWYERCKDADIICPWMYWMKSDKVYDLKNVFISVPYVGVDFLDKNKLKERNITVANSPWCNKEAVVEWIIGMILTYFRNLNKLIWVTNELIKDDIMKSWTSLFNKKITILWHWNVWKLLWKVCKSFGMKVKYYKRWDDLIKSVKNADIVANCLSYNEKTKWLLDKKFFFLLKKWTFFVSSSRHEIYDIDAMIEALNNDFLIGIADDSASSLAWDIEYPGYKRLLNHPKIIVTPHIAWNTDYEKRKANDMMIDNIEAWLNKKPINLI